MGAATVRRFTDLDALSRAAAADTTAIIRAAVDERGACSIALSGGSTPERLFRLLAQRGAGVPWDLVSLWWGDERTVPPDHAQSNYRMAREALIAPLGLADSRVHRIAAEQADAGEAARAYERELVAAHGAPPVLDLILLGMGSDGHTASLFPDSPALDERDEVSQVGVELAPAGSTGEPPRTAQRAARWIDEPGRGMGGGNPTVSSGGSPRRGENAPRGITAPTRWVVANPVTSPLVGGTATRITLTAPAINAARHVRFLVAGADKAAALAQVLEGPRDPRRYPSQLIAPVTGDLMWLVDAAAAASLRGTP